MADLTMPLRLMVRADTPPFLREMWREYYQMKLERIPAKPRYYRANNPAVPTIQTRAEAAAAEEARRQYRIYELRQSREHTKNRLEMIERELLALTGETQ